MNNLFKNCLFDETKKDAEVFNTKEEIIKGYESYQKEFAKVRGDEKNIDDEKFNEILNSELDSEIQAQYEKILIAILEWMKTNYYVFAVDVNNPKAVFAIRNYGRYDISEEDLFREGYIAFFADPKVSLEENLFQLRLKVKLYLDTLFF